MPTRVLPTGTITFLFSDIEGSTRLVADVGPSVFRDILEAHNTILRAAFGAHDGTERGTQGDSFLVMFRDAPAAVAAAVDVQRAVAGHPWPEGAPVRVRMGLHTGLGVLGGDDYVGLDVNRAARIAAAAHGGQVLLSEPTRALAGREMPDGVGLRDLGQHALRDLPDDERLYQLVIPGLRTDFPPIRSASTPAPDLPHRTRPLIGRDRELDELRALLGEQRLVTLTGPGGTGKSSLAVEVGRRMADEAPVHVHWVPLSSVTDPTLLASAIAERLGVAPVPGRSPIDGVCDLLADRPVLLILDNMEHLLGAAGDVAEMLRRAPRSRIVVTSRAPLHLSLEQEYPVRPLAVPSPDDAPADVQDNPCVRLFLERAARVRPGFRAEGPDMDAVSVICRRLDGLPLGIELAASRVGVLPVRSIADRLVQQLDLPGPALRDVPERQRTLTAAIAWSHDLLEDHPRRLFARLSVFAGGARLDEVEAVCVPGDAAADDVLDGLTTLVDQNLLLARSDPDGLRVRMLDTIRMFATERLAGDPATEMETRRRHALAYLALVEAAAGHMPGRGQVIWLDRLSLEHDNLRAATDWAIEAGETDVAFRLGGAAWRFWQLRGHVVEGRAVMARILAQPTTDGPSIARCRALGAAGSLAWWTADIPAAHSWYLAAADEARATADPRAIADAAYDLGHTENVLHPGSSDVIALRDEALRLYQELGDERSVTRVLWTGGWLLLASGREQEAFELMLTLLPRFEALDDQFYVSMTTLALGGISLQMGAPDAAMRWGLRSLLAQHAMGDVMSFTLGLRGVCLVLLAMGHPGEAALFNAAFDGLCRRYGIRPPADLSTWLSVITVDAEILATLTSKQWAAEIARGTSMTVDGAMEELLQLSRAWGFGLEPSAGDRVDLPATAVDIDR